MRSRLIDGDQVVEALGDRASLVGCSTRARSERKSARTEPDPTPEPARPNPTRRLNDPRPTEVGPNEVGPSDPRVNGPQPGATWRPDGGVFLGGHRRLLGVFAHPDDETFCAGGTFAGYAARGAEVMVISATRGQAGQIRDAAVGTRRTIGAVRRAGTTACLRAPRYYAGPLPGLPRRRSGRCRLCGPGGRSGRYYPGVPAGRRDHFRS